jgi:hypothetical protein
MSAFWGVKRTSQIRSVMPAYDPKATSADTISFPRRGQA